MNQYTHAWLAFRAVQRLDEVKHSRTSEAHARSLVSWFHGHRDDVIQGAWYPDEVIHDNGTSHILKITPAGEATNRFKRIPTTCLSWRLVKDSPRVAADMAAVPALAGLSVVAQGAATDRSGDRQRTRTRRPVAS
ncbi:MAG: hypothetical protein JW876_11445 [Candidatus Krumholzibacteriota bacterium]|nr:hypothetical protein [Candidatus Krumholzibacteriota bacterium]